MSKNEAIAVDRLREESLDRAADVLARAFFTDPYTVYILPDDEIREDLLYWYFGALIQYGLLCGEVDTVASGAAVAVWLPQGDPEQDANALQQSGLLDAPDMLGMEAFTRLVTITGHLERVRKQLAPTRHWYLPAIGVDPAQQGRGWGGALLRPALARADADGRSCYLETFQPANGPFYQRRGFRLLGAEIEPVSGLPFWTFGRDPRL